jgi:hypothetical protein
MKIARFRQPAVGALAVLLISGAGIAFAANSPSAAPSAAAPAAEPATTPAPVVEPSAEPVAPAADPSAEPVEPAGADTDTLQEGDQTTPDAAEPAEAAGTETEAAGAEEPGDASLPGGGHADDPNDPNADHQFEGVE